MNCSRFNMWPRALSSKALREVLKAFSARGFITRDQSSTSFHGEIARMKLTPAILILLIASLAVANVKIVPDQTTTPAAQSENRPPESVNIVQTSIRSTILDEDRRVIIHLPRNYSKDSAQKYPVMYVLDGTSQDDH